MYVTTSVVIHDLPFIVMLSEELIQPFAKFPTFCFESLSIQVTQESGPTDIVLGLSPGNKLYFATTKQAIALMISPNVTSFSVSGSFLIYLTTAHDSVYAPLYDILSLLEKEANQVDELRSTWETRRVERGSRIVTTIPSEMSLVLQMPRGNLETINPRPLTLEVIKLYVQRYELDNPFLSLLTAITD